MVQLVSKISNLCDHKSGSHEVSRENRYVQGSMGDALASGRLDAPLAVKDILFSAKKIMLKFEHFSKCIPEMYPPGPGS